MNGNSSAGDGQHRQIVYQPRHQQQPQPPQYTLSHLKQAKLKGKKSRDSSCCSINFIKYVLQTFNIIFFMSGDAVIAVALWTIFWKHEYISLLATPWYFVITYGLLLSGLLAVSAAIWGCCSIWREARPMICGYSFLLIVVFALQFSVGGFAYIYETQIDDELLHTLNRTFMSRYGVDETQTIAIDSMQQKFKCCGAIRFEEWRESVWLNATGLNDSIRSNDERIVPDSCCVTYRIKCGRSDHPSNIPYTGCIYRFIDEMRDHLNVIAAVGSSLCFIQLFGLILSCCLFFKLKGINE